MTIRLFILTSSLLVCNLITAQNYSGTVLNEINTPIENVKVYIVEEDKTTFTNNLGLWSFNEKKATSRTIVFYKEGFAYEQLVNQEPSTTIRINLKKAIKSEAALREEGYLLNGCSTVQIPNDPEWNVGFKISRLKGDLAPDPEVTRRDPSAIIQVNGIYYMWYSYSHSFNKKKIAPWDLTDLYYATSADGIYWNEKGIAVGRGEKGSFDHRSVFTTEILAHNGKYYLIYQAAADKDGIYNRNTVGMATSITPDGPWVKLSEPVLHPTYTNDLFFDNNAVHDPCIVPYNNKFYLYYKGECNCRDNSDCKNWCNPICGIQKQVKWGVAIADNPTGPYVKSTSNPITNTGHEIMAWPYKEGIAILQHQDGPEGNTIQFSENGLDFNIKGSVSNIPEAAGLFRSEKSNTNPHKGIEWGVGHELNWSPVPWMYIYKFEKVKNDSTLK